ncbi:MAG: hypothetical protein MK135_16565, partial [Polyangiaceae bacterium]|nr:hypothetical protein [Polyangiaceae bacterium]
MRVRSTPHLLLARFVSEVDPGEQKATFRQALVALAQAVQDLGPPPLDELDPVVLEAALHLALERGYLDESDFMAPSDRAVALYELSSPLAPGAVKREIRRRVFALLYEGSCGTFVAV